MTHELDKYDVVVVTFNDSQRAIKQEYSYKMHASFKPEKGDTVVVESPYNGLVTCTVQRVMSKNSYGAERATKWVVDKVDCRFYHNLLEDEKARAVLAAKAVEDARKINTIEQFMQSLPVNSKARKYLKQAIAEL